MENMQEMGRFVAEGFSFYTEKDAVMAEDERRKIAYLESKLDFDNPKRILSVYNKAIEERVFQSPVGIYFLKGLQEYLLKQSEIDSESVSVIPMYVSFYDDVRRQTSPARTRVAAPTPAKEKKSAALPVSIVLNIVLVIAIIAMFGITLKADQPNILNYERVLTNRYASWEQELTKREQVVREKEREFQIDSP